MREVSDVVRSTNQGNARASECGTDDKVQMLTLFAFIPTLTANVERPAATKRNMKFKEALLVANEKEKLVKQLKFNGATLDEVLIAPTNPDEFSKFEKSYVDTLNAEAAIVPFMQSDLKVIGVFDKHLIRKENIVIFSEI